MRPEAGFEGGNWREKNERAGWLKDDDCRECSGMGRVPVSVTTEFGFPMARYGNCPLCGGAGKVKKLEWHTCDCGNTHPADQECEECLDRRMRENRDIAGGGDLEI